MTRWRYHGKCPDCGKLIYESRKEAKQAKRRQFPNERVQAYACPTTDGWFHLGHIAPEIVAGEFSKKVFYGQGVADARARAGTRKPIKRTAA